MGDKIHNRVKDFRVERMLTQDDLARQVGVSRQSINSIERERYIPSLPLALRFAGFFGCSVEELFQLEEEN